MIDVLVFISHIEDRVCLPSAGTVDFADPVRFNSDLSQRAGLFRRLDGDRQSFGV
jgi:hypothetical protein